MQFGIFSVSDITRDPVSGETPSEAERIDAVVQIAQKAGIDGKLFGSVTSNDIAEALKALGFEIEKSAIRLAEGPLKHVGDHVVTVALHGEVGAHITVSVLGED